MKALCSFGLSALFFSSPLAATQHVVTTLADQFDTPSGSSLSLREAIRDAVAGDTITFSPALNGGVMILTNGQFDIAKNLTIDASALSRGLVIDANRQSRIFSIGSNRIVTLQGLTLTGGLVAASGGAILSERGRLTLNACTLSGNSCGNSGGGIYSNGDSGTATLTLNSCTLSGNTATRGGGICNDGAVTGNATLDLVACTLSANHAVNGGGGIANTRNLGISGRAAVSLTHTIVAGNFAGTGPDLWETNEATTLASGNNLLSNTAGSTLSPGESVIVQPPRLAPLGNYGGPAETMPPLAGSPAIDTAGTINPGGTDQRGFARFVHGMLDIGAVESGPLTVVDNAGDDAGSATTLRKALADTATIQGAVIRFDPAVFDAGPAGIIKLSTGTPLEIAGTADGLLIDASNLTGGLTLDADAGSTGPHRVLTVNAGATAALQGLTLTGGRATSDAPGDSGGGIHNDHAVLTLNACTLADNHSAVRGGAIFNDGVLGSATLTLNACTLTGNSSTSGGGIHGYGQLGVSKVTLNACTLTGNSAGPGGGGGFAGGGIGGVNIVTLANSIVAGNVADISPDLRQTGGTTIRRGTVLLSDLADSGLTAGPFVLVGDPRLAPMGHYGGPSPTMPPLAGSPAIDAAGATSSATTDQRGFPRFVNGALDIGAVELGPVTLVNNSGDDAAVATTLRKALADSASTPGAVIRFDPALFHDETPITLGSTQLEIPGTANGLLIDASNLSRGLTLRASTSRLFKVNPGAIAALHGVTLTGGRAPAPPAISWGGAIYIDHASLTLNASSLSGNSAIRGGGIGCDGSGPGRATLALNSTTLSGNSADYGGGIYQTGASSGHSSATLTASTLSGNSAQFAGAIYSDGNPSGDTTLKLVACTVSGNSASTAGAIMNNGKSGKAELILASSTIAGNSGVSYGGVLNYGPLGRATLILDHSIVAGNTAATGPDVGVENGEKPTIRGVNVVSNLSDSTLTAGPSVLVGDPRLAPLGNYGGPTRTMPPLAGSPAIDAAGSTRPGGTDQRGFSRFVNAARDIGAVETGAVTLVDTRGDGAGTTLRQALADASATPGAVVRFDPELFSGEPADTITLIGPQLEIPGSAHGLLVDASDITGGVTIDASLATSGRVLLVHPDAVAALQGLTLSGGNATLLGYPGNSGGGIFNDRATLTLNGCTIRGNSALSGGGIYNNGNAARATLTLNTCMLLGNFAASGGGISSQGSNAFGNAILTVNACVFSGNSALASGGGIHSTYQAPARASALLSSCTLTANGAPYGFGGGLYTEGSGPARYATLHNCVVWDNVDGLASRDAPNSDVNVVAPGSSRNLLQRGSIDGSWVISDSNPMFVRNPDPGDGNWNTLGNNDYGDLRLLAGSPAIDTGGSSAFLAGSGRVTDLAGEPRFFDDPATGDTGTGLFRYLDLGAYEGAFVSFATRYPGLDPGLDANHNGTSNFDDYAAGADPRTPNDPGVAPMIADGKVTFSYRPYTLDVLVDFQKSGTLQAGSWSSMIEGVDYHVSATTSQGMRALITLDLILDPLAQPSQFFRERFSPAP